MREPGLTRSGRVLECCIRNSRSIFFGVFEVISCDVSFVCVCACVCGCDLAGLGVIVPVTVPVTQKPARSCFDLDFDCVCA